MLANHPRKEPRLIRNLLTAFVLLTCLRVWLGPVRLVEPVQARIIDPGAQRKLLLDETKHTNQLLADLAKTLKTHTFKVKVEGADKETGKRPVPPRAARTTRPHD